MTKKRNKKTTVLKQKQSQVVNVYSAPRRRNPLSQNSAPIVRHAYHQVPTFNPLPNRFETNQQPVGTKSESDVLISGLRAEIKMIQKAHEIDNEIHRQSEFMSTLKPLVGMHSNKSTEVHHFKPEADSDQTKRINTNLNKHFGYEAQTTSSSLKKA